MSNIYSRLRMLDYGLYVKAIESASAVCLNNRITDTKLAAAIEVSMVVLALHALEAKQ